MFITINKKNTIYNDKNFDELYCKDLNSTLFVSGMIRQEMRNLPVDNILYEFQQSKSHETAEKYFAGGYFIVFIDEKDKKITLLRDVSGIKTGYYHFDTTSQIIITSTNVHDIARSIDTDLSELWVDFLLYQSYVPDGNTIYTNIKEVEIGEIKEIDLIIGSSTSQKKKLPICFTENNYSEQENILLLREHIIKAHEELVSLNNTIYLSGGIDSCAMLAALYNICPDRIRNVSYKVKGTNQDETFYAKRVAKHLGYSTEIIEVDPNNINIVKNFEEDVQSFNNPYLGNWIFKPYKINPDERFFAGQDTRLHTPSVNSIDQKVISNIVLGNNSIKGSKHIIAIYEKIAIALKFYKSSNNNIKYSHLLLNMINSDEFIMKRKFQVDWVKYKSQGYRTDYFEDIKNWYTLDLQSKISERSVYNQIVEKKWKEQYIADIRYMVDMGRSQEVNTVLPFYQNKLNLFASTIPWDMANREIIGLDGFSNRKVKVNKYLLRKAFENELPWDIMVRAKSVSKSNHLLFNGVIGTKIAQVIEEDLNSIDSFCHRFGLEKNAKMILSRNEWKPHDLHLIGFATYIGSLCIYYKRNVLKKE